MNKLSAHAIFISIRGVKKTQWWSNLWAALCTGMYVEVELHAATAYKRNGKSPSLFPPDPIQRHGRAEAVANLNSHHSNKKSAVWLYARNGEPTLNERLIQRHTEDFLKVSYELVHYTFFIFWAMRARATFSVAVDCETDYYLENNLVQSNSVYSGPKSDQNHGLAVTTNNSRDLEDF